MSYPSCHPHSFASSATATPVPATTPDGWLLLIGAGCDKVFVEHASGVLAKRPALDDALDCLRDGDTLVVTKLGRSVRNLKQIVDGLQHRNVGLKALSQGIDVLTVPQKLSAAQVQEADLAGWRQILSRIKARFRTGELMTGMSLTIQIGQLAAAGQAHPEVILTSGDVVVALSPPDVRGITTRDLDLARRISDVAAGLGVAADVSGLTQLELGLDAKAGEDLAPFYAALLGSEVQRGEPVDPSGQVPTVWWQDPSETDEELALPEKAFEQRWHFDVWIPHDEAEHRLQAMTDAGGRLVSDAAAPVCLECSVVLSGRGRRRQPLLHLHTIRSLTHR